jgi:hypothetical protein
MFCLPDEPSGAGGGAGERGFAIKESIGRTVERQNVKAFFGLADPEVDDGELASVTDAGSTRFLTWALGAKSMGQGDHVRACTEMSLETLAKRAKQLDKKAIISLSEVRACKKFRSPRPPGYAAATWIHILGDKISALCDYGATSSGVSEELACLLSSYCNAEIAKGSLEAKDSPILNVESYEEPSGLQGVSGASMATKYAVLLDCEFVGIGICKPLRAAETRGCRNKGVPKTKCYDLGGKCAHMSNKQGSTTQTAKKEQATSQRIHARMLNTW